MSRTIGVEPENLETQAQKIEFWAADYKTQYEALYARAGAMQQQWSGKDNQVFISQIKGFRADFQNMHQLMLDYAQFLRTSARSYRDTQDNIAAEAGTLAN